MVEIKGFYWTSSFGDSAVMEDGSELTSCAQTWAQVLGGLSNDQIRQGIEAVAMGANPRAPSLNEFRGMCLGIPTEFSVICGIREGADSPFLQLVRENLDYHLYRSADDRGARAMVREAYAMAREHVMRGFALPAPKPKIEHEAPQAPRAIPEEKRGPLSERLRNAAKEAGL